MLGGGNPVGGGNPAGIGQTLNYIGDRVYAYSGDLQALSGGQTFLKFTTGSELIVAMFQFYNSQDDSTATEWQIFIDSQEVVGTTSLGVTLGCSSTRLVIDLTIAKPTGIANNSNNFILCLFPWLQDMQAPL